MIERTNKYYIRLTDDLNMEYDCLLIVENKTDVNKAKELIKLCKEDLLWDYTLEDIKSYLKNGIKNVQLIELKKAYKVTY